MTDLIILHYIEQILFGLLDVDVPKHIVLWLKCEVLNYKQLNFELSFLVKHCKVDKITLHDVKDISKVVVIPDKIVFESDVMYIFDTEVLYYYHSKFCGSDIKLVMCKDVVLSDINKFKKVVYVSYYGDYLKNSGSSLVENYCKYNGVEFNEIKV